MELIVDSWIAPASRQISSYYSNPCRSHSLQNQYLTGSLNWGGVGWGGGFLNPFLPWQKFAQDVGETGKKFLVPTNVVTKVVYQ